MCMGAAVRLPPCTHHPGLCQPCEPFSQSTSMLPQPFNCRLIASATSIGLNGTLAIGLAKVAGLDLWSKFDWGATDDFKLALFLGGPLLAYELLLLGIPWYSPFLSKKASSSITINSDGSMARSAGESQTSSSSSSSGSNSAGSSSIPVFKGSSIGAEADDEEKPTGAWLPHKDAQGKWEKGEAGSAPPPSAPSGSGEADAGHGQEEAAGSSRSAITSAEGSGGNGSSGSSSSGSSTEAASARKPGPMDEELSSLTRTISDSRKTPSGKAKSKKGGLPFNMRIDASSLGDGGQSLNAETIKIALALQQAAFTATQAVMRAGTPFALDAGLTLARDAAKVGLQVVLVVVELLWGTSCATEQVHGLQVVACAVGARADGLGQVSGGLEQLALPTASPPVRRSCCSAA